MSPVEYEYRTVWRITGLSGVGREVRGLDVQLVVDTVAPVVVSAIEHAAARAGIQIERVLPPQEPERSSAGS